jgi:hypothetical protein
MSQLAIVWIVCMAWSVIMSAMILTSDYWADTRFGQFFTRVFLGIVKLLTRRPR